MKNKAWTKEENKKLKKLYPKFYADELVPIFGRSFNAIKKHASHLGINSNRIGKNRLENRKKLHYSYDTNFFSSITILNSYWAGLLAADGNIYKRSVNRGAEISLSLKYSDLEILEKFKEDIQYSGKIRVYDVKASYDKKKKFKSCWIRLCSDDLAKDLETNFNITSKKSLTLRPPKNLNYKQSLAFITGYLDGDGFIGLRVRKNGNRSLRFGILGTLEMLSWIHKVLFSNSNFTFDSIPIHKQKGTNIYCYSLQGPKCLFALEELLMVNVPRFSRKWNKVKDFKQWRKLL